MSAKSSVARALSAAALCAAPVAAQARQAPDATELDRVVVVASKTAEPAAQVVGTVSQIDQDALQRRQAHTIADMVRYEPGVSAIGDANRFGWQGFSIRGLEGNRVGMEIDGIPLAEVFAVGQFASAGRDLVDLEAVQRVEILRGPASTLYGSDALAGVVAYRTRTPQDLLERVSGGYVGGKLSYAQRDRSRGASLSLAQGNAAGTMRGMLLLARRQGHESENASRVHPANPQHYTRDGVLGKAVWEGADAGRWTFTLDHGQGDADTDVRSMRFGPGRFSTTTELLSHDRYQRDRASAQAEWQHGLPWLQRSELLLYRQRSVTRQDAWQTRLPDRATPFPSLRERRFELAQTHQGLEWLGQVRTGEGSVRHWHVFGLDIAQTDYSGQRDGREINLRTGASSNVVLGERFPVRDFPNSRARELGVFWQDEIRFGPHLALIPGMRWERYRLHADADALFRANYPNTPVVDVARDAWTPKLGARWTFSENAVLFAQYARGFRAPPFGDVNIGLSLAALNYEVRPNPDLRAESSHGLELGWRWHGERARLELSAYRNRYRDLIESRANLGTDPETGALVFQSVNRARAYIQGLEASAEFSPDAQSPWSLRAAAAWAQGRDSSRDAPLNSVAPGKLIVGALWEPLDSRWGAELNAVAVQQQPRLDQSAGALFRAPGYAVADAYLWWRPRDGVRLNLALQNLTDRRYWDWSGVRGVAPDAANLAFYTAPGRNFSLSLALEW